MPRHFCLLPLYLSRHGTLATAVRCFHVFPFFILFAVVDVVFVVTFHIAPIVLRFTYEGFKFQRVRVCIVCTAANDLFYILMHDDGYVLDINSGVLKLYSFLHFLCI